jgi:hypothetical protein
MTRRKIIAKPRPRPLTTSTLILYQQEQRANYTKRLPTKSKGGSQVNIYIEKRSVRHVSHQTTKESKMQRELFKGVIVKDRVVIKEYLAQCLRILKGEAK